MKSHVVYSLNCMDCIASYTGVITRVLAAKVQEHRDAFKDAQT